MRASRRRRRSATAVRGISTQAGSRRAGASVWTAVGPTHVVERRPPTPTLSLEVGRQLPSRPRPATTHRCRHRQRVSRPRLARAERRQGAADWQVPDRDHQGDQPDRRDGLVADRRYSTARWQRLRKAVLNRDGHLCRIQAPGCRGRAVSVHHVQASSQAPHLFWEPSNLVSACSKCNYGGGRQIAADNSRRRTEQLEQIILQQDQRIQQLLERLQQYESEQPHKPPQPAIY